MFNKELKEANSHLLQANSELQQANSELQQANNSLLQANSKLRTELASAIKAKESLTESLAESAKLVEQFNRELKLSASAGEWRSISPVDFDEEDSLWISTAGQMIRVAPAFVNEWMPDGTNKTAVANPHIMGMECTEGEARAALRCLSRQSKE